MIQSWSSVTLDALQGFWQGFIGFIPNLIGAAIILIIGWLIAIWVGKLIALLLNKAKFDVVFEKTKWQEALEKAEFKMDMSEFVGSLIKWVLIIVFLLAAVEILGMSQFASFLSGIVSWLPNVVISVAIFIVAVIISDFFEKMMKAFAGKMNVKYIGLVGSIVKWAIWVFALLAILGQLGVASEIIQILVTGFVALIVIGGGLAFGLGGKDMARDALENLKNKLR
ncbi:MAG: hypothetical protein PHE77_02745 [Candidatus Pacebacteria bacterium]|nr:hypothetical protein [Candidatus Paceibacterota bacterium]